MYTINELWEKIKCLRDRIDDLEMDNITIKNRIDELECNNSNLLEMLGNIRSAINACTIIDKRSAVK